MLLVLVISVALLATSPASSQHIPPHLRAHVHEPFFQRFIANQRHGFPFPGGRECEADAHRLCGGVVRECVGSFGCSMQCMTDHVPKLSEACRRVHPCYPDIDKYCPHVKGGKNGMMTCLRKHHDQLAKACLKHHPCLAPDKHCVDIDYNAPPADFVGDIGTFLKTLRSGALFPPLRQLFHLPRHRNHPVVRHHPPHPQPAHRVPSFYHRRHFPDADQRELRAERMELLNERRELDRERQAFFHERLLANKAKPRALPTASVLQMGASSHTTPTVFITLLSIALVFVVLL